MAATPIGPYTRVVRFGDMLVTSGQIGAVDGTIVPGGFLAELEQAVANVASVLGSEGASLADVVKTTVFLRHMSDYAAMNTRYMELFGDHRPARTACGVSELPIGALVEIEAWAYAPPSG